MKRILLFALSFSALTLVLTWLWLAGGNAFYGLTMQPVAREINEWIGLSGPGTMLRNRFINMVPFVSLMLITPRLSLRKRLGGLAIGLLVLGHRGGAGLSPNRRSVASSWAWLALLR